MHTADRDRVGCGKIPAAESTEVQVRRREFCFRSTPEPITFRKSVVDGYIRDTPLLIRSDRAGEQNPSRRSYYYRFTLSPVYPTTGIQEGVNLIPAAAV